MLSSFAVQTKGAKPVLNNIREAGTAGEHRSRLGGIEDDLGELGAVDRPFQLE